MVNDPADIAITPDGQDGLGDELERGNRNPDRPRNPGRGQPGHRRRRPVCDRDHPRRQQGLHGELQRRHRHPHQSRHSHGRHADSGRAPARRDRDHPERRQGYMSRTTARTRSRPSRWRPAPPGPPSPWATGRSPWPSPRMEPSCTWPTTQATRSRRSAPRPTRPERPSPWPTPRRSPSHPTAPWPTRPTTAPGTVTPITVATGATGTPITGVGTQPYRWRSPRTGQPATWRGPGHPERSPRSTSAPGPPARRSPWAIRPAASRSRPTRHRWPRSRSARLAGSPTTFNASASTVTYGTIARYVWEFGDGATAVSLTPTVSHTYAAAGVYTSRVTETSSGGDLDHAGLHREDDEPQRGTERCGDAHRRREQAVRPVAAETPGLRLPVEAGGDREEADHDDAPRHSPGPASLREAHRPLQGHADAVHAASARECERERAEEPPQAHRDRPRALLDQGRQVEDHQGPRGAQRPPPGTAQPEGEMPGDGRDAVGEREADRESVRR